MVVVTSMVLQGINNEKNVMKLFKRIKLLNNTNDDGHKEDIKYFKNVKNMFIPKSKKLVIRKIWAFYGR